MHANPKKSTHTERALYVHLPWCARKCPYCDFNSHTFDTQFPEQDYVEALIRDLNFEACTFENTQISTIFFGGGTPSLFKAQSIERVINEVHKLFPVTDPCEITLEANPGSSEQKKFLALRRAGINRLSLGIQSFNDEKLKALGRIHSSAEAIAAIQQAQECDFPSMNLDLMFALPNQSVTEAINDLDILLSFQIPHLSYYQLTLEPNTYFHRYPPALPADNDSWQMACLGQHKLKDSGYQHYEISAYAQAEHQCQHNLNYWQYGDYLAIGAGAHGKITQHQQIQRYAKVKHPRDYMRVAGSLDSYQTNAIVETDALPFEYMLNRLRLSDGLNLKHFSERTFVSAEKLESALEQAKIKDLLRQQDESYKVTPMGYRFLNDLVELFLPEG